MTSPIQYNKCVLIVISSDLLQGRFVDADAPYIQTLCRKLKLPLVETRVIGNENKEAVIRAVKQSIDGSTLVIVAGGTGPSADDDVTYSAVADVFGLQCKVHDQTMSRMQDISLQKEKNADATNSFDWTTESDNLNRKRHMATLPVGNDSQSVEVFYPVDKMWVPLVLVGGSVLITSSVPFILRKLLNNFKESITSRIHPDCLRVAEVTFKTSGSGGKYSSTISTFNRDQKLAKTKVKAYSYPGATDTAERFVVVKGPTTEAVNAVVEDLQTKLSQLAIEK